MGIFTKDIKSMEDLFLHQLEDIYYAEQQLTKAIPKMADMATNADSGIHPAFVVAGKNGDQCGPEEIILQAS